MRASDSAACLPCARAPRAIRSWWHMQVCHVHGSWTILHQRAAYVWRTHSSSVNRLYAFKRLHILFFFQDGAFQSAPSSPTLPLPSQSFDSSAGPLYEVRICACYCFPFSLFVVPFFYSLSSSIPEALITQCKLCTFVRKCVYFLL